MSTTWHQVFQPTTAPAVAFPIWRATIVLGPVVAFEPIKTNDGIGYVQAYPVGTGNAVSDKVEFVMEHNIGPFQFGVRDEEAGTTLIVRFASTRDIAAFNVAFPEVTA